MSTTVTATSVLKAVTAEVGPQEGLVENRNRWCMLLPPTKPDPKQVILRIVLCGYWGLTCLIHRGC